jgi:hypothetical protein
MARRVVAAMGCDPTTMRVDRVELDGDEVTIDVSAREVCEADDVVIDLVKVIP